MSVYIQRRRASFTTYGPPCSITRSILFHTSHPLYASHLTHAFDNDITTPAFFIFAPPHIAAKVPLQTSTAGVPFYDPCFFPSGWFPVSTVTEFHCGLREYQIPPLETDTYVLWELAAVSVGISSWGVGHICV